MNAHDDRSRAIDDEVVESLDEIFAEQFAATAQQVDDGADDALREAWRAAQELFLPGIGLPEDLGGAGGELPQVLGLAFAAGRRSVSLPFVENHLAGYVLTSSDLTLDEEPDVVRTFALAEDGAELRADGTFVGTFRAVGWSRFAQRLVTIVGGPGSATVVEVDLATARIEPGVDLAGQQLDTVHVDGIPIRVADAGVARDDVVRRDALLRASLSAGALQELSSSTVTYAKQREQFGRPIAAFQSVQTHLVTIEEAATSVAIAVRRAAGSVAEGRPDAPFAIDALRVITFDAIGQAVAAAHQAHGAIGMTREFGLQRLTRRLNSWRWLPEDPARAAHRLGNEVLARGSMHESIADTAGARV